MNTCSINDLFLLDDIQFYPFNKLECLAYNPRNNKKLKIGFDDAENGSLCTYFLTLDEHVSNIKLARPDFNREDIKNSLKKMLNAGLMITPPEFINHLTLCENKKTTNQKNDTKVKNWTLAICSGDRPALVSRLLKTITPHLKDLVIKPIILLIDDSRSLESNQEYFQIMQEFCKTNNLEYEFWDRKERAKYCQELGKSLPNCQQSIQYLLSPDYHPVEKNTTGQVRNFAVLRSAGKPLLMLDDDCLINPLEDKSYQQVTTLGYSGRRGHVKPSYDELFVTLKKSAINPLREHLKVLSSPLQSSLIDSNLSNQSYWKGKSRDILIDLNKSSFIAMSVNSIAGALNSRQMDWFYHLEGKDLLQGASLLDSLEDKQDLSIDQATWNGRESDEASRSAPFIGTTICGVAPLELIPPMPPTGRNQDLALGATINFLYKDALLFQFGWGLPHLPDPPRNWQPFGEQQEPEFNSTSFYIMLTLNIIDNCPYTKPVDRLKYLSTYLNNMSETEIASLIKDIEYEHHTYMISKIRTSNQEASLYPKYQKGCEKMINYHINEMKLISEKISQLETDVSVLSRPFTQALNDWPEIWSHSKNVKAHLNDQ